MGRSFVIEITGRDILSPTSMGRLLQSAARMSDMRNYCVLRKEVNPNYYNHLYLDDSRLTYLCQKQ